jgi:hypothetical protein
MQKKVKFIRATSSSHFVIHNGWYYNDVFVLESDWCSAQYENLSALTTQKF